MDMSLSKLREMVKDREACPGMLQSTGLQSIGRDWATEQQQSALRSVSSLSFPSLFLLWATVQLTWGKFYIKTSVKHINKKCILYVNKICILYVTEKYNASCYFMNLDPDVPF